MEEEVDLQRLLWRARHHSPLQDLQGTVVDAIEDPKERMVLLLLMFLQMLVKVVIKEKEKKKGGGNAR